MFFTQRKIASKQRKRLFRRMMGHDDYLTADPTDIHTSGLRYLFDYSIEEALLMMTSDEWTRAIWVRDPKERAFSIKALRTTEPTCRAVVAPTRASAPKPLRRLRDSSRWLRSVGTPCGFRSRGEWRDGTGASSPSLANSKTRPARARTCSALSMLGRG